MRYTPNISLASFTWKLWVHKIDRKDKEQWGWVLEPTIPETIHFSGLYTLEFEGYGSSEKDANDNAIEFLRINEFNPNFKRFSYRRYSK